LSAVEVGQAQLYGAVEVFKPGAGGFAGGDFTAVFVGAADFEPQFAEGGDGFVVLLVAFEGVGVFAQGFKTVLIFVGDAVPLDALGAPAHLLVALGDEVGYFSAFDAAFFLVVVLFEQAGRHGVLLALEGQAAVFYLLRGGEQRNEQEE